MSFPVRVNRKGYADMIPCPGCVGDAVKRIPARFGAGNSDVRESKMNCTGIKKTYFYLKRNGIRKTWSAVRERLEDKKQKPYAWLPPTPEELRAQRSYAQVQSFSVSFSVIVPAYHTPEKCLRELILSLLSQSYENWELILADASSDDSVRTILQEYEDRRIRYVRLAGNGGISENTNEALTYVLGDYVGLLDHDDVLTPDALFEMALQIEGKRKEGQLPRLLYSDEDKCNSDMSAFFEPHRKEEFNLDLILSNNYICHFLVMQTKLIQELGFRKAFDGAQDYDLVLRAVARLWDTPEMIVHIPKILYHWRCHSGSTAENPQSKLYAYEAGKRAVQAFAEQMGWRAYAEDTEHLGFYRLRYAEKLFSVRQDVGAVGGRLVSHGKICGGRMTAEGSVLYEGLPAAYSGYMHRAVLQQDAAALDIRNLELRESFWKLFEEIVGVPYTALPETGKFDFATLPERTDIVAVSLRLSRALRERGFRLLYLPEY